MTSRTLLATLVIALVAGMGLAGCATQTVKHGQFFSEQEVSQIQPGMSSDQVKASLGTPSTTSTIDGQVYYYISNTTEQQTFLPSTEVDRRVIAIYFDQIGSVEKVANYGLKDGKIFDYIARTTPTAMPDKGLLGQLFRGVGKKQLAPSSGQGSPN